MGAQDNDTNAQQISTPSHDGGGTATTLFKPEPLLWEAHQKDGLLWSSFAYQIIGNDVADVLLPGSIDIKDFCSNYDSLSDSARVNFWAFLISAVAKYESGFDPLSRMVESTMGTDPITGLPVYSEGLLQLSYQDIQAYPFCAFDWQADKTKAPSSSKKTILDPFKNLECGIRILAQQIHRTKRIALSSGVYWSTLKVNGKYTKLPEIQKLTQGLPFCSPPN